MPDAKTERIACRCPRTPPFPPKRRSRPAPAARRGATCPSGCNAAPRRRAQPARARRRAVRPRHRAARRTPLPGGARGLGAGAGAGARQPRLPGQRRPPARATRRPAPSHARVSVRHARRKNAPAPGEGARAFGEIRGRRVYSAPRNASRSSRWPCERSMLKRCSWNLMAA